MDNQTTVMIVAFMFLIGIYFYFENLQSKRMRPVVEKEIEIADLKLQLMKAELDKIGEEESQSPKV